MRPPVGATVDGQHQAHGWWKTVWRGALPKLGFLAGRERAGPNTSEHARGAPGGNSVLPGKDAQAPKSVFGRDGERASPASLTKSLQQLAAAYTDRQNRAPLAREVELMAPGLRKQVAVRHSFQKMQVQDY